MIIRLNKVHHSTSCLRLHDGPWVLFTGPSMNGKGVRKPELVRREITLWGPGHRRANSLTINNYISQSTYDSLTYSRHLHSNTPLANTFHTHFYTARACGSVEDYLIMIVEDSFDETRHNDIKSYFLWFMSCNILTFQAR